MALFIVLRLERSVLFITFELTFGQFCVRKVPDLIKFYEPLRQNRHTLAKIAEPLSVSSRFKNFKNTLRGAHLAILRAPEFKLGLPKLAQKVPPKR